MEQQVYVFVTISNGNSTTIDGRTSEVGKLVSLPADSRVEDAVIAMISEYSANGFIPEWHSRRLFDANGVA